MLNYHVVAKQNGFTEWKWEKAPVSQWQMNRNKQSIWKNLKFVLCCFPILPSHLLQTGSILWITACSSREHIVHSYSHGLCSYTGVIHFNIYLYEYFVLVFFLLFFSCGVKNKVEITKQVWGGRDAQCLAAEWRWEAWKRSSKREIVHSRKKNHCVTPGEKYCCFA